MRLAMWFCTLLFALSVWGFIAFGVIYLTHLSHVQFAAASEICGGVSIVWILIALLAHRWSEQ